MVILYHFRVMLPDPMARGTRSAPLLACPAVAPGAASPITLISLQRPLSPLGMLLFDESREILRLFCIVLIIAGILGLQLVDSQ